MRITAIALGLVLGGTVSVVAQEERPSAPHESIKVHGHWTIEVREPDGTLVTHREFENSLNNGAGYLLGLLLAHRRIPGTWAIMVFDGLCPSDLFDRGCTILESRSGRQPTAKEFPNLLVVEGGDGLTLTGSFTATNAGSVTSVETRLGSCTIESAPNECTSSGLPSQPFSGTALGTPVPVQQGQIVQVRVTISFF